MAYTRRQELMCTEDQMIAKPSVVLRENEAIYIKMNNGTLRQKIGDGATAIINLPFTQVFDGSVVQATGESETAVMSQKAATEELSGIKNGKLHLNIIENEYISTNTTLNGVPQKYNGWDRTDFVECEGYNCLYIKSNTTVEQNNAFYDADKNFISLFYIYKVNGFYAVPVPKNAKYFILSGERSAVSSFVVRTNIVSMNEANLTSDIKGTTQTIAFNDADGTPSAVTHAVANGNVIRTDTFVFGDSTIEETRILANGEQIKFILNKSTLSMEVK